MTEKEYRAHPAISRSELWRMNESPEKFKYYREHPPEPTASLVFGQVVHKWVLQPESFWDEFITLPDADRRTKEGKAVYADFLERAAGKTVITANVLRQAQDMRDALRAHRLARPLLDGEKETAYFWTDDLTGEACKCRCDIVVYAGDAAPLIVDYKTTSCAKQDVFNNEIYRFGYHFQAAMYSEGVMRALGLSERPEFRLIAQEKKPPYAVNVVEVTPDVMLAGEEKYRELLGKYHACRETGYWYGYNGPFDEPNETYLPGYMSMGEEEED